MSPDDSVPKSKENTDSISLAMDRLWIRFRPEIMQRIAVIESAVDAVDGNHCTGELRLEAYMAAHKLAGSLGTFGLPQGTEIARLLEQAFAPEQDSASAAALPVLIKQLRFLVENR